MALLDDDPVRPDESTAEAEKGDPEESREQRCEGNAVRDFSVVWHVGFPSNLCLSITGGHDEVGADVWKPGDHGKAAKGSSLTPVRESTGTPGSLLDRFAR